MGKEAYDDYKRYLRDKEANSQKYLVLEASSSNTSLSFETPSALESSQVFLDTHASTRSVPSSSLRVGDLVRLEKNQRVPADLVLLHTSDASGTCFIRTDQLDGETDWKLRVAVPETQKVREADLSTLDAEVYADAPIKDIHTFVGTFTINTPPKVDTLSHSQSQTLTPSPSLLNAESMPLRTPSLPPSISPLTAENMLWANTVLAAGKLIILPTFKTNASQVPQSVSWFTQDLKLEQS